MPKVTAAVAALIVILALAGCADSGEQTISSERSSASSATEEETPTPLVAETAEPSAIGDDTDLEFADYVRSELALLPQTGIADATDDQLVAAGQDACEQLLEGVDSESIRLVEGEQASAGGYYMDTLTIVDGARRYYCPETIF